MENNLADGNRTTTFSHEIHMSYIYQVILEHSHQPHSQAQGGGWE